MDDGTRRKVMSACHFQKGTSLADNRKKSCIVCDKCVYVDEEGTGHIYNKAGKCSVCIKQKRIGTNDAAFANFPATEVPEMTAMFATLCDSGWRTKNV